MFRVCSKCKEEKSLDHFYTPKRGHRKGKCQAECKDCRAKRATKWRYANPDKYREQYDRARYKMMYGLKPQDVKKFGICPICLCEKRLVVDHDHKKVRGQYRGFLCNVCNILLGHLENAAKMARIIDYLKQPDVQEAGVHKEAPENVE